MVEAAQIPAVIDAFHRAARGFAAARGESLDR
jgi:hypothetical protein